jgi:hypothetical protein
LFVLTVFPLIVKKGYQGEGRWGGYSASPLLGGPLVTAVV